MLPYLDEERVRSLLRLEDLIPVMERALIDLSAGRVVQPPRQMLEAPSPGAHFAAMPAAGAVGMGAKLVSIYPANAASGPAHPSRADRAVPARRPASRWRCMDGRLITEMRTAAVSAVATRALARARMRECWPSWAAACRRAAMSRHCAWCAISPRSASGAGRRRMPSDSRPRSAVVARLRRGRGARRRRGRDRHRCHDAGAGRRVAQAGCPRQRDRLGRARTAASSTTRRCARAWSWPTRARA